MKFLVIGDPHFKTSNKIDSNAMSKKTIELVKENSEIEFVVILGDTLDRHSNIHVSPLNRSINWIKELSNLKPVYLIIGNHDRPNNSIYLTEEHPFNALKYWNNVQVIDVVQKYTINGFTIVIVPYVPNGRFKEALDTIDVQLDSIDLIIAHQEFRGAKMGAIISEDGDLWDLTDPNVISGHLHDYQRPQPNIYYTGTPFQHGWGDTVKKTVSIFNLTEEPTEGSTEGSTERGQLEEEKISLNMKQKKIIHLKYQDFVKFDHLKYTKYYLKLVIKGTNVEISKILIDKKLTFLNNKGIKIVFKEVGEEDINEVDEEESDFISSIEEKIKQINNKQVTIIWKEIKSSV